MSWIVRLSLYCAVLLQLSTALPTIGCNAPPNYYAGSHFTISLKSGGFNRTALINFPSNYGRLGATSPLIVAYHGSMRTSDFMEQQSQFSNETYNPNAVVVYPQGVGGHWQGSPLANPDVNDIQFTEALLQYVSENFCLDTSSFFASGHSNGGGFVNTIACWPGISGKFAAFAPMSFAVYAGSQGPNGKCQPDHPVTPILEMHGKMDTVIPYNGGAAQGSTVPPVLTTMKNWVIRNGCSDGDLSSTMPYPGKVTLYQNDICKVQQWTFAAMQHYWPSNTSVTPEGDFKTPVEGTSVIINFFNSYL